ncbi:DUF3492 domain-containing protein [Streptomyces meridianus]|uniref:D-inositol 3-phosphate glycosyltransferase n=1 Tax=Streptomyces meridianus TaxID=2938945 RepID=A0ABT0X0T9_9ACTN|nr:DUF3492 domain-containing protein [Streptomyces meridianus]MCM2576171.1 DUF3492 domain-containing protein [Streptomyces meridianus]
MRIGLLTESGYPYATGESGRWCDRLVRGLPEHDFDIFALTRGRPAPVGDPPVPRQVRRVRTAPLLGPAALAAPLGGSAGRRWRRRFAEHFGQLVSAVCAPGQRQPAGSGPSGPGPAADPGFAEALYGLAELAREHPGLPGALRSEAAARILERACRTPRALPAVNAAQPADLLAVAEELERRLRPLSLDWHADDEKGLGSLDLCHATSSGAAALPGLLAKRFHGVPLLVTEHGSGLREHYLDRSRAPLGAPARALLASFRGRTAAEVYDRAAVVTAGNTHVRRWQQRCGADPARMQTVYPGWEDHGLTAVAEPEADDAADTSDSGRTLVWVGHVEPSKDLVALLHAFARVRREMPGARLLIAETGPRGGASAGHPESTVYTAHCRALAAQLFPDEAASALAVGDNPVAFEPVGGLEIPRLADAYTAGGVAVLSSVVEGFPIGLVESMFAARATVSTDVGAVCEVIGGTGLVVPPRNPRALADACLALLRDSGRRARLGAAARARALELFTVEQNVSSYRGLYLELVSHCPVEREEAGPDGGPLLFGRTAESSVPGSWAAAAAPVAVPAARTRTVPIAASPVRGGVPHRAGTAPDPVGPKAARVLRGGEGRA